MKTCIACQQTLPEKEFNKRNDKRRQARCRWCLRLTRKYRPPVVRVKMKRQARDQLRAQSQLRDAVRKGTITKPSHCDNCHKVYNRKHIHGHHFNGYKDYALVEWLCYRCHAVAHMIATPNMAP